MHPYTHTKTTHSTYKHANTNQDKIYYKHMRTYEYRVFRMLRKIKIYRSSRSPTTTRRKELLISYTAPELTYHTHTHKVTYACKHAGKQANIHANTNTNTKIGTHRIRFPSMSLKDESMRVFSAMAIMDKEKKCFSCLFTELRHYTLEETYTQ